MYPTFGETVRRLREARGLSQKQLGQRAGTSQTNISRWERYDTFPDQQCCEMVATGLGISVGELLAEAGHTLPSTGAVMRFEVTVMRLR